MTRESGLLMLMVVAGCHSTPQNPESLHNQGVVTIDSRSYRSGNQTYGQGSVGAAFVREQVDPFLGCKRQSFGACTVHYDCQPVHVDPLPDMASTSDLGVSAYASAGLITVAGLPVEVSLTLMTTGMFVGQYTVFQQYMPLFMGGELLVVNAQGGEVPPFQAPVTAPDQPTITLPAPMPPTLQRTRDFRLEWSNGGKGDLRVSMSVPQPTGNPGLDCVFPGVAGSATIPSAVLQTLPPGNGIVSFSVVSRTQLTAGVWQVDLTATTGPLTTAGIPYEQLGVILE